MATVWVSIAAIYAIILVVFKQVTFPMTSEDEGQSISLITTTTLSNVSTSDYPTTTNDSRQVSVMSMLVERNVTNMTNQSNISILPVEFDIICMHEENTNHFYDAYFKWIDIAVYSFIPTCIIFVSNFLVILTLFRHSQNVQLRETKGVGQKNVKITQMLLFVSCYFLVATVPSVLYPLFGPQYFDESFVFSPDNIWYVSTTTLALSNYCINFYVFMVFNESYRKDFVLMVKSVLGRKA